MSYVSKKLKISFDFGHTLAIRKKNKWVPNQDMREMLEYYHSEGDECYIISSLSYSRVDLTEIVDFLKENNLTGHIQKIIFSAHGMKGPICKALGVSIHYDDIASQLESVRNCGITGISPYVEEACYYY